METQYEPFLRVVARAMAKAHPTDLHRLCFVFPNRRSTVWFSKELEEVCLSSPQPTLSILSPAITTISDLVCDITGSVEVSRTEALLLLHQIYSKLMGKRAEGFDRFSYWGDIILNDFNDIDKSLADPKAVLNNVRDYKSIRSNFLTQEQIDAISRYFGDKWLMHTGSDDHFWRDPRIYNSRATRKFLTIWDALFQIYIDFNKSLNELGMSYSGQIYRNAAKITKETAAEDFPHNLYVFVGFNLLSLSEVKIFKNLADKGIADFYWDHNTPPLRDPSNSASFYVSRNAKMFPSRISLDEPRIDSYTIIDAVGVPSITGQSKYAGHIIQQFIKEGVISDPSNAINTAIVLPDERATSILFDSLPSQIDNVNITMGFKLHSSSIAQLVRIAAQMHRRCRKSERGVTYFRQNISDLATHPLIKKAVPNEALALADVLAHNNGYYIDHQVLVQTAPTLSEIFVPIADTTSATELVQYVRRILNFIESALFDNDQNAQDSVEMGFMSAYFDQLNQLAGVVAKYNPQMSRSTFFYLIGRHIGSSSVAFEGEPMRGLQVMGLLETRCLDFENLIILSANERILPRKHYSRSFIPSGLRRPFGLPTIDAQEAMYAYYFYRMIGRAKRVTIIYDNRLLSFRTHEPSRYLKQLTTVYPESHIRHKFVSFQVTTPQKSPIVKPKNERIMDRLSRYLNPESDKYLSASSINKYISCPLSFYFEKVEDFYIEDPATEYINDATLGTIVHAILQQIYQSAVSPGDNLITPEKIKHILSDQNALNRLIQTNINLAQFHISNCDKILNSETYLAGEAIDVFIKSVLRYDKDETGPFRIISSEKEEKMQWTTPSGLTLNLKMFIDRVDEVSDSNSGQFVRRIIDYKTGKDNPSTASIDRLFNGAAKDRPKAHLQLLLYCNAYADLHHYSQAIRPMIYKIRDMRKSGLNISRKTINDYRDVNAEFLQGIDNVISEIFNPQVPFTQATCQDICKNCKYAELCHF